MATLRGSPLRTGWSAGGVDELDGLIGTRGAGGAQLNGRRAGRAGGAPHLFGCLGIAECVFRWVSLGLDTFRAAHSAVTGAVHLTGSTIKLWTLRPILPVRS
jgi:hypothetical protein